MGVTASPGEAGLKPPGGPAGTQDFRLGRNRRLTQNLLFDEAFAQGIRHAGRYLVLWVRRGEGADRRLGVVASRRSLPEAHDRVRAKRLLREAYRLNRDCLVDTADIVLVARTAIRNVAYGDVKKDFLMAAARLGLTVASAARDRT